jgi:hypothetical protein
MMILIQRGWILMRIFLHRRLSAAAGLGIAAMTVALTPQVAVAAPGGSIGFSSSDPPYLVRHVPGVTFTSLLTVGDSVGGYRMAGIPDGLGAFDNGDGTFTVLMNHEIPAGQGVTRAHGARGAFVSNWVIDKETLRVLSGSDLIRKIFLRVDGEYVATPGVELSRLCSADLPARTALFNPETGSGYDGRIFLDGEETAGGRAFGHVVATGESYHLADLGSANWENVVANPSTGDKTVVVGTSDTVDGNVIVYSGTKEKTIGSNPVEKAGLTGGERYTISVPELPTEDGAKAVPTGPMEFTLASGAGTGWDRPEDGSWDPRNPSDFYFTTTASFSEHSRLWRLRFTDIAEPTAGGTVEMVLEGPADPATATNGPKMMDNITVNSRGQVLIQEDPGNQQYLAGIYRYDISSRTLQRIADHDPQRFLTGGTAFDTIDEESSGIIPAPFLGAGKYLLDVQNHTPLPDGLVEKGQLVVMGLPPGKP